MSLVLKYYAPYSGRILIDGVDIKDVNTRWLRRQMGLVSQEFSLFDGTINDNITYGLEPGQVGQSFCLNEIHLLILINLYIFFYSVLVHST